METSGPCPPKFAPRKIMTDDLHLDDSDFTLDKLRTVLRSLKKNKATFPDDTSADLLKLFDDSNLQSVLLLPNDCWNRSSLECTRVTSIFKQGNPELLSNYRPIFLSVFCKLFASLVLSTFRPKIGPYIWKTQLGFEKTHSTQAVFWARGVQDQAEMSGTNLNFTLLDLLDFEKASDKIDHWKLVEALQCLNISGKTCRNIAPLCAAFPASSFKIRNCNLTFTPSKAVSAKAALSVLVFSFFWWLFSLMKFMIELELRCWTTDCLTCGIVICCMPMTCYLLPRTPIKWIRFLKSSNKNLLTTIWSSTIRSVRSFPWTDNIGLLSSMEHVLKTLTFLSI